MKSLRSAFATLTRAKVQVIGVSMDSVVEQRAFSEKFRVPFPLLCDPRGAICDAFRVEHPGERPRRETFLFRKGVLVHHDREVDPARQAADVMARIEAMPNRE